MMPDIMVRPCLPDIFRILAAYCGGIHANYDIVVDGPTDIGVEVANEAMLRAKFGNCEFLLKSLNGAT